MEKFWLKVENMIYYIYNLVYNSKNKERKKRILIIKFYKERGYYYFFCFKGYIIIK